MIYTPGAIYRESPQRMEETMPCLECGKPMSALTRYDMPTQWRCIRKGCCMSIFKVVKVPSYTEDINMGIDRFYS